MPGPHIQVPAQVADYLDVPASTFMRGPDRLSCEHHEDRSGFALVLSTPGGGSITQRFPDVGSLSRRRTALEQTLVTAGWVSESIAGQSVRHR
jgi:hypothetical protein